MGKSKSTHKVFFFYIFQYNDDVLISQALTESHKLSQPVTCPTETIIDHPVLVSKKKKKSPKSIVKKSPVFESRLHREETQFQLNQKKKKEKLKVQTPHHFSGRRRHQNKNKKRIER